MKTFTKHILLLALMLFGVAGAAWADHVPQKYTSAVNLSELQVGDTLAEGASITYDIGNPGWDRIMRVERYRAKKNGTLVTGIYGEEINNIDCTIGAGGVIIDGSNSFTPVTQSGDDGDAWVVTFLNVEVEGELIAINISGVLLPIPAPSVPVKDNLTGNWNFLMPGSNKVVKAVLYDSIVLGPHVSVAVQPVQDFISYTRGDSTVLYYDPTLTNSSFGFIANDDDGNGRNFSFWADDQDNHVTDRDFGGFSELTCGQRFVAVYPENHTLTLVTPQGGGTLELASVGVDTVYTITIGGEQHIVRAADMPYDTTFDYLNGYEGYDQSVNGGNGNVTLVDFGTTWTNISISGAFDGQAEYHCTVKYAGLEYGEDNKIITCTASTQPKMPYGISKTGNNTYSVMEGLTVNVTATPDSAHYLSAIDGLDTVSNYACGYSFTMPDDNTELAATFAAKPTLTLAQTDGGTLEALIPSGAPTTAQLNVPSEWMTDNTGVSASHLPGFVAMTDEEAQAIACPDAEGTVRVIFMLQGDGYLRVIQFSNGVKAEQPFTIARGLNKLYNDCNGTVIIKYYYTTGATAANVIASSTPNTYYIDYGTPVTVVATPDAQHYLVSFSDDDNDTNSNIAVEKTYDSVINNIPLSANFQAKPVLTLTANDGGTLTLDGMTTRDSALYNITIINQPQNITAYPYQKVFNFNGDVTEVSGGDANVSITKTGQKQVTVTVNRGFSGTVNLGGAEFDGEDNISILIPVSGTPAGSIQLVELPEGVASANATLDTFVVDYGTTVTVTATPDSVHYLATLGGVTMGSNTAKDTTFAVTATTNLAATFAQKPTLTLAHNDGGTLEAIVPQTEPVLLTTIIPTTTSISTGTWTNDTVTVTLAGQLALEENRWVALYGDGNQGSVSVTAAAGFSIDSCKFYINEDSYTVTAAPFAVYPFCDGSWQKVFTLPNAQGSEFWSGGVTRIEVYTTTRPNVIASSTPNTYYIDYNTSVTVKATPSDTAYLVRFDQDADTNSNTAVEKTYGPLTAALTTAEATFNDKPVLTLAQNESWGSVSVSGPVVWNNQVWGSWNMISTSFPQTIGDITINKNNFYCYYSSGKLLLHRSVDNNSYVTFTSAGDNFTRIEMTYTGGSNLEPANEWTCANGVAVWEGDAQSVTITNAKDFTITQIKFIRGSGVEQLTAGTYRVDYGTTVTVQAAATELHHVANWVNEDSVAYPAADITYSAYFITEPEPLFPDSSTLTLTLTADATAKALFGINSYDVVATAQLDDRAEIGTDTSMGYIAVSYIDIVGDAQTVAATDTAEITAQGGSASVFTVTPHYGYLFTGWSVTQNNQTTQSTQNPLTLTEAATVVARFVPDTFEVSTFTATPADTLASAGTVTGADRYAYRTLVTLEETPATGYHFVNWSNTERTALGTETTVTVQLMQDTAIFAVMDTNVYDITYTIQTDDRDEIGTNEPMGSVVLEGRHMHFLNDVLEATATYGYVFEGWYSNDELASTDNPFTFSPTEAVTYEARFLPDTFTVSLTMNDEHAGDVLPHGQLPAGVTVGPNVTYRVPYLVPMTFYGAAMEHNHIVNWINENDAEYVDGVTYSDYLVCDTFPTTSLLTLAVTGDTTVKINFLVDYYYVTVGLDEESTGRGTVTGSGYYDHGDTVTAMASPAEGYHFDGWDNGVEISPYAFAAVQDSTILVHFDTNVYSLTVVAETDTNTGLPMGTTLGDGLVKHFLYYDIEAVAEEGYHFVMWTDSVTDNPRTVTLTENTTFTAHFEMDPIVDVVINGVSADETMGTVSGSDTVDYGEEVILTATANEHYHFVQWNDGNSDNPRTVVAAHDSTLTAYFAVNQYAVVGVSADETMGTVSGSDTADYQSVVVLTATAGDCYHFESWSDGETANPRSIVAEADTTVSALFAANVYSMNDTVTVCDSYEWNGTVYTQSGTYTHDGTTAAGCDMLETLYLTVNASTTAVETVTACDSYEWHDSVYTASTDESTYQTTNAAGCDSTVTLHLIVNAATASEESETACNYYTWHGETYTVSGDYSYTTQNAAGCDSTVTLHLTVNYGNLISIDSTVCDSIVWRGNVYTESGVYDFDLPSESGCFSIETLNLTVNYSSSAVETIFACDSYTWNGLQFDADNHTATYFTVNAVGCDSTVMLDLTVHYSNEGTDNVTACDSVEWHGTVYTASDNTATYSTINAAGCDSTVVLVLTINHSVSDTVEVTAEESYEWNGEVYSQSGTYTYSGTTEAGCDSTVTLLLTITYQPQPVYYTVTLVSADTTMGSVLPAEAMSVEEGSQFSATAIALYGRHFVAWERDGQVVSTDNPYSFEVTEDVELTATFAYNPVTVILSVNNANWGSTDPAPGTYTYEVGEQATVTATPAEGFHMMGWTINGTVIETDETTYTVEATPEMAGMTFSVVAMFVRDIAIDDVEDGNIAVYASEGKIVVSGAEHRDVYVYDVTGRCVSRQADAAETVVFPVAQTGVYMVKIGNLPARKVALVR